MLSVEGLNSQLEDTDQPNRSNNNNKTRNQDPTICYLKQKHLQKFSCHCYRLNMKGWKKDMAHKQTKTKQDYDTHTR